MLNFKDVKKMKFRGYKKPLLKTHLKRKRHSFKTSVAQQ
ncbi:hypothetical protein AQPE_5033 [Aquipluma nitroreducens]|uniref:Uncharacterized protein n=1 Tax=Aquipluma nitroreducens TaxID=2010828 RepID=A0A5K7SH68_9BACT|nr:hypothetical protein AQPE_5033 [Aquipluma nitroreducens]